MKGIRRILLIGSLIYLSFACMSCSTIDRELITTKEECIQQLDLKYIEIQEKNVEYSLVFIENVIEEAKNQMDSEKDKEKVISITETALEELDNLLLDDEGIDIIKNAWVVAANEYWEGDIPFTADDFKKVSYYFGNYDGKYVAIIEEGDRIIRFPIDKFAYTICCNNIMKILVFTDIPKPLCVVSGGIYYEIDDAVELCIITDEELMDIHSKCSLVLS